MVLLVGTHITRKSPCHIITMAMGWTEYVLKDEEVLLKDERGTAKTEESSVVSSSMFALLTLCSSLPALSMD
jgi:hypothetical protein